MQTYSKSLTSIAVTVPDIGYAAAERYHQCPPRTTDRYALYKSSAIKTVPLIGVS